MLAVGSCVVLMLLLMDLCFGVHFDLVAFDSVFLLFTCFTGSCNRLSALRSGFCPFSKLLLEFVDQLVSYFLVFLVTKSTIMSLVF